MDNRKIAFTPKRLASRDKSREVDFLISDATEDRVGDTIDPAGWHLDNYLKNPVVLWGHDKRTPPIGKCTSLRVEPRGLFATVQFATAEEFPLADTVYRLVKGGYLNACSVGFKPVRWEFREDDGIDFKEQELLEWSVVTIPANPNAIAVARSIGIDTRTYAKDLVSRMAAGTVDAPAYLAAEAYKAALGAPFDVYDKSGMHAGTIYDAEFRISPAYQRELARRNFPAAPTPAKTRKAADLRRKKLAINRRAALLI